MKLLIVVGYLVGARLAAQTDFYNMTWGV